MMDASQLIRSHLASIETYEPADSSEVLAQQGDVPLEKVIRLNANENPYGPSPRVREALANLDSLHIYPDPQQRQIRTALSSYTGADPAYLLAGNGADELIDLLLRLTLEPGEVVLDCEPTFGMYAFCARVCGGHVRSVPRDERFEVDPEEVVKAVDSKTKVVFVASPNNPTGDVTSEKGIKSLLNLGILVVVDETYHEFANHTVAHLVPRHDNLVVLRSLSKWAGLAGLRIGYGIMSPKLVNHLMDIKPPYNINVAAEAALLASLEDTEYLLHNVHLIIDEKERLFRRLTEMESVVPWPSHGNFILCQFPEGTAQQVYERLARKGIFVRHFKDARLVDFQRISVGTPQENDVLLEALGEVL